MNAQVVSKFYIVTQWAFSNSCPHELYCVCHQSNNQI